MITTWLTRIALVAVAFAGGAGAAHLLGSAATAPTAPAAVQAAPAGATTPSDAAIEAGVRRYILQNPEIIQEALVELERRQREAENEARARVTRDPKSPLYVSKGHTVVGNPEGDVTIVEFFDYNCGFCKRGLADLQRLMERDGRIRLILKEFPILSPGSVEAARVALALRNQFQPDRLWQFHGKLLAVRGAIGKEAALGVAKELGADMARLEADLGSPAVAEAIEETRRIADALGLTGTPSYVVGDEVVVGAVGFDALKERVDNVRRCGRSTCS